MEHIKLIDGEFDPLEAKEILLNMISNKIQFHSIRDFSSDIRTGTPDKNSRKRLSELREAREQIIAFLEKAKKEGWSVNIQSSVNISCIKGEQV